MDELAYVDTLSIVEEKTGRKLYTKIAEADGGDIINSCLFRDRSSVANKFLQVTARKKSTSKQDIWSGLQLGPNRNGGQETCNIYSMIEALNQGALVVGNGPSDFSVWAAPAVGGDQGDILEDESGIRYRLWCWYEGGACI